MNVMINDMSEDLDTTVQGIQVAITLFLLVMAALKLVLLDFGSLGQLGNILALIAAGLVFMAVAWFAPMPPGADTVVMQEDAAPEGQGALLQNFEQTLSTQVEPGPMQSPSSTHAFGPHTPPGPPSSVTQAADAV